MTYVGPSTMGGTSESYIYKDASGGKYLFKVAKDKNVANVVPFRAYIQEAGYKVQYIVDPETAVDVKTVMMNGKLGSLQRIVEKSGDADELKSWFISGKNLSKDTITQIQREHVSDWLLANYDGHINNFITSKSGKLIGLDKEQAMKYLNKKQAQAMSLTYHPNAVYGEHEPVYNKLFRQYADGTIDIDLNDALPFIKRVEAISDKEYREIFREYAESLCGGAGKQAEALLDAIVERKKNLRETYRTFYEELIEKRTGKKVVFKFLDEGTTAAKQTLSAVTMTEEAASKLSLAELKKIAKSNNVPNFGNMTKKQLVTCVSDPSKVQEMSNQVKLKLQAQAAKRKAQATATVTPKKPVSTSGIRQAGDVFDDLDSVPIKTNGICVSADFDALEGQNLTLRRVVVDGNDYVEISGKLTNDAWIDALDGFRNAGAINSTFIYEQGIIDKGIVSLDRSGSVWDGRGLKVKIGDVFLEIANEAGAQKGLIRIRALANKGVDSLQVKQALRKVGLEFITDNPTQEAELLMKKARLLWQRNPSVAKQFSSSKNKTAEIDKYLKQAGINPKDANKLVLEEVYDGYSTYLDYDAVKTYKKEGMEYVWCGVRSKESIVAMVKSGGMQASRRRLANGFRGAGSSINSDMSTGGADSVFTRIATRGSYAGQNKYIQSYAGGNYQIIFKDDIMARTDWYAYEGDEFGDIGYIGGYKHKSAVDFVKSMSNYYSTNNEIMFRHGIRLEDWAGIDTGDASTKSQLIYELNQEGITEINGIPLDKFIRVNAIAGKPLK